MTREHDRHTPPGETEDLYRALVESALDIIWEVDERAVYRYISPRVTDILGYEPGELIGKRPFDFMRPDEAERVSAEFAGIAPKGRPFSRLRSEVLHKSGSIVVFETDDRRRKGFARARTDSDNWPTCCPRPSVRRMSKATSRSSVEERLRRSGTRWRMLTRGSMSWTRSPRRTAPERRRTPPKCSLTGWRGGLEQSTWRRGRMGARSL